MMDVHSVKDEVALGDSALNDLNAGICLVCTEAPALLSCVQGSDSYLFDILTCSVTLVFKKFHLLLILDSLIHALQQTVANES